MVNLDDILRELREEKARINAVIEELSVLQNSHVDYERVFPKPKSRRGRKSMSKAERQEVSVRMRNYWGQRRARLQTQAAAG
jgi:hypothetical protein